MANVGGAKLNPDDLVPKFQPPKPVSWDQASAALSAFLGRKQKK